MASSAQDFKSEYAKSGRASCKSCRNTITQGSLRLALMVQSPHFDGKIPNWFHYDCFWKRARVSKTQEIHGFDSLRWEDQEKIKERIAGGGGSGGGGGGGKKGSTKDASESSDYVTEYAKSSQSKCRSCENKINKNEVRLGKKDFESERAKMYGPQKNWYHVDCFVSEREELGFTTDMAPSTMEGFSSLKEEDRDAVIEKLGKGKKRKAGTDNNKKPAKKTKEEIQEEEKLKEQSKLIWSFRDELESAVSTNALKGLLEYNGQVLPSGESKLLDAVSDSMVFGALKPCPECGEGQLRYQKKYKYVPRTRVFPAVDEEFETAGPVSSAVDVVDSGKPLGGCKLAIVGKLSKSKAEIKKVVEALGGTIVSKVDAETTACLSSQEELDKMSKGIKDAKKGDVNVINESFLDAAKDGVVVDLITTHTISTWGSDPTSRIAEQKPVKSVGKSKQQMKSGMQEAMFKKSLPGKMTLKVKGGAAVDPDSGLEDTCHLLLDTTSNEPYNAVLNAVDIVKGQNSYYKLQALESDTSSTLYIFRSWGRVGTSIGNTKLAKFSSKMSAVTEFKNLFYEKTLNRWDDRKNFVKQPNKFVMLEMDYGQDEPDIQVDLSKSSSKLDHAIQDIIRIIFDIESMKKAMLEFEIDLAKMPLGKLSKNQIRNAYKVLAELQQLYDNKGSTTMILDGTNRFYSLIPHDFGMKEMPLLDTQESIKAKIEMLDNLLDIEVAYSLLKSGEAGSDPIDSHYHKLKTDMKVVDKDSEVYKRLVAYVDNTHGVTHTMYTLEVLEIFEIARHGEDERFAPFKEMHNRKLLWHGSRKTNYAGIMSQGLRIAPPEAPSTGYMFGKGVYFADMVTKSANYCNTNMADCIGLMLLGEVALGNMHELTGSSYITQLPKGKHSTKGVGGTCPDPVGSYTTEDGVEIPMGKGMKTNISSSLLYNEYIVYDTAQINLKYLFKMKFNYKW